MSRSHFKGTSFAYAKWMQDAADEIARGERKGAIRKWPVAHQTIRNVNRKLWWPTLGRKRA